MAAAPARAPTRATREETSTPDHLRALSPQVAAVLRKEFRYLTRNSFAFLTLILPPMLVLLFSSQFSGKHPVIHRSVSPDMFFPGMMAYLLLILMAPSYNAFAYEGRGLQT